MTPEQLQTLDFVRSHIETMGFAPTYPEIGAHFGITTTAAFYRVEQLVEAGHLRKTSSRKRGLDLVGVVDLRALSSGALQAELMRRGEMVGATSVPERRVLGHTRTCAVDCCDIAVKVGHLMCRDHWFAVPFDLREAVKDANVVARRSRDADDAARYGELVWRAKEKAAAGKRAA